MVVYRSPLASAVRAFSRDVLEGLLFFWFLFCVVLAEGGER